MITLQLTEQMITMRRLKVTNIISYIISKHKLKFMC